MPFIDNLIAQKLIQDTSDIEALRALKSGDGFYVGFDPTAPSLQVGNLVPLIMSLKLAKEGLRPIILFGGSTGAIGDPSGKNAERVLLEREVLDKNIAFQSEQVRTMFAREKVQPDFVNNLDWTKNISVLDFLRDVGKHFTVNYMIAKEVVKNRLSGEGISYTEFSYMLLQAFDFHHLYKHHNCRMQIGGSDQWGNITAGLELIRRKEGENTAVAFSIPLLTNSEGKKFGKTESGTLWLDPDKTSSYQFHQFWLNTADADAERYLNVFTLLSPTEIRTIMDEQQKAPEKRHAQKILADTITTFVHGADAVTAANKSAQVLFGGDITGLSDSELLSIFADVPSVTVNRGEAIDGPLLDLLVNAKIIKSKGEARRLIAGGGVSINGTKITESHAKASDVCEVAGSVLVIRVGKKSYTLIKLSA